MKSVSSVVRICISSSVALAALALHAGQAAGQVCPGAGMALFEQDGGISAVETGGNWLRILPSGMLVTMATVEKLPPCVDPEFRVSPDGTQLITWPYDDEIISVTNNETVATKLPEGERLWAADVGFNNAGRAVIAALLYRDTEEPRLNLLLDSKPGAGEFNPPISVTGAKCGSGTTAVGTTAAGEVMVLCEGSFTIFNSYESGFDLATFPLELADRQLILAVPVPMKANRVTFFAIVKDLTAEIDPTYELVRIRVDPQGGQRIDTVLDDVAYAGGDHGLAAITDVNLVYMDEAGLRQVVGSRGSDDWNTGVIHPLRREAKLSAQVDPPRVLITEYEVKMLTLTEVGWEYTTLFAVGTPPASPPAKEDSGCSAAGADPATGLAQVLLVTLALALATRLARRRSAAHGASCPSRSSLPSGRSW